MANASESRPKRLIPAELRPDQVTAIVDTREQVLLERMSRAAAKIVQGMTIADAARELNIAPASLREWTSKNVETWQRLIDRATEELVPILRQEAGTDAVLVDPTKYLRSAEHAEKWLEQRGTTLFPTNGEATLSTFFHDTPFPTPRFLSP